MRCWPIVLALTWLAAAPAGADETLAPARGRWLQGTARHQQGDLGPLPPASPGRSGVFRSERGDRVLEGSATHPFSVGHYGPWACGPGGGGGLPYWVRIPAPDGSGAEFIDVPWSGACRR